MINKNSNRFDELSTEIDQIEAGKVQKHSGYGNYFSVDEEKFDEWRIKAKSLISRACGKDSQHLAAFTSAELPQHFDSNYEILKRLRPIFQLHVVISKVGISHQFGA